MEQRFDARQRRQRMTPAEKRLWAVLRGGRLHGAKFRRQHPFGRFVLDFSCPAARLAIDVDGEIRSHQVEYDGARTAFLESRGIRVIRFKNDDILHDLSAVVSRIWEALPLGTHRVMRRPELDNASPRTPLHRGGEGAGGEVVAFDVYGTLVDPLAMHEPLAAIVGADQAGDAAALWRRTQLEYSFRRGLMGPERYVDFDRCTSQALRFTLISYGIEAGQGAEAALLGAYRALPAFPDARQGLERLRTAGHRLLAFSNGTEAGVRAVLGHAGVLPLLDGVVSVDDLRTFKPSPAVYAYLVERGGRPPEHTWLVTANPWDAIGAKAAGLRVAWLRRNPATVFDPWEEEFAPDIAVSGLGELPFLDA